MFYHKAQKSVLKSYCVKSSIFGYTSLVNLCVLDQYFGPCFPCCINSKTADSEHPLHSCFSAVSKADTTQRLRPRQMLHDLQIFSPAVSLYTL